MNSYSSKTESLKPLYMSQTEANEVMELWAHRQQEEAARQSMVTVHDVAEATQLSQSEVEKLLSEIRSRHSDSAGERGRFQRADRSLVRESNEISLVAAYRRLAPYAGVLAGGLSFWMHAEVDRWARETNYDQHYRRLETLQIILGLYALLTLVSFIARPFFRKLSLLPEFSSLRKVIKSAHD